MKNFLCFIFAIVATSTRVSAAAEMKTDALAVRFDAQGRMAVDSLYGKPFPLNGNFKDGVLELTVPLVRGCATVKLTPNP